MLRTFAGIIVGFIVMAVIVMAVFGIAVLALGGFANVVQAGSYWTTDTFNIIVLIGGTIAAIVGGVVCVLIARSRNAALALAVITLTLGAVGAIIQMGRPDPPARTGDVSMADMQTHGKEPAWFAWSKTILGAVGVVIGSSLVRRKPNEAHRPHGV